MQKPTLIVGSGLAGSCMAYQLYHRKTPFLWLQSDQPKASDVAAGIINPLVFRRITKSWEIDTLLPYLQSFYGEIEQATQSSFLHPIEMVKTIHNPQQWGEWISRQEDNHSYIGKMHRENFPNSVISGEYGWAEIKQVHWLQIGDFTSAISSLLSDYAIKTATLTDGQIQSISTEKQITVDGKTIELDKVILCTGSYWKDNPLLPQLPFAPVKGELLLIQSSELKLDRLYNKDFWILPIGNDQYKAGSTFDWKDLTFTPTLQGKNTLLEKLRGVVKCEFKIIDHQAGVRPASPDRRPILGEIPNYEDVYIFNGLGTKGSMFAPYFSEHLYQYIFEKTDLMPEANLNRWKKHWTS